MGEMTVPEEALWGAGTQRAVENFTVSPLRIPEAMLKALAMIKGAAALANGELGLLPEAAAGAIHGAAGEILEGRHREQFPVDVFQTGSGTSWNMNINEVLSRLAARRLSGENPPGAADKESSQDNPPASFLHPNDHINRGQSSNDVIPSAINIAARLGCEDLEGALRVLGESLAAKAREFAQIPKLGRTHLQDAVPMTLGNEFSGYASQIQKSLLRLRGVYPRLEELALGGTALGTGVNTHPDFAPLVIKKINRQTGQNFRQADNLFEAIAARDSNLELMSALNLCAAALAKIAGDLRLLASGPRGALGEITLPALQPGSSIMPGKVNPVIPEMVLQACACVMGKQVTLTIACQTGPLELNIMMPLIAHELLFSLELLTKTITRFEEKCIRGIRADEERCRGFIRQSLALATPLALILGYDRAAALASKAFREQKTIEEAALEEGLLSREALQELLNPETLAGIKGPSAFQKPGGKETE
jgi:fumarate hydratase class II